jgi:hypothetical protein
VSVSTCPTQFGIEGQTPPKGPSSMNAPASVANDVRGYSNGFISMLAPAGWSCSGLAAADGGQGLDAYPSGQAPSALQIPTGTPSNALAVSVQIPSQGTGPASQLACPYFPTAATGSGVPCQTPPPGEIVHRGGANFVEVQDPPGVAGLLTPSGGPDPANGVVVWNATDAYAAEAVCTLPEQERELCTVVLNDFLARYGNPPPPTPAPPTTAAPAASSLPKVEVCGMQPAVIEPTSMTLTCADGYSVATDLHWTSWTDTQAIATGLDTWNTCVPYCAASTTWDQTTAEFTLTDPVPAASGVLFESLVVQDTGSTPPGMLRTQTYSEAPVSQ